MIFDVVGLRRSERMVLFYLVEGIAQAEALGQTSARKARLLQVTLENTPDNGRTDAFNTIMASLTGAAGLAAAAIDLQNALVGVKV